ncbi:MAG: tRNA pseudouridine(55) synthase TruB [Desulfobacterales bacterium]|nr:tRNA pseudouridine(55) synthase TruB [Desulfobacterales bacterium]
MKDGILVVNKPAGISSAGVVGRLKRILGVKKIGHTGTLDPFATGVLLIAIQKATRISRFFLDGSKGYRAQVTLGMETDTYDCTGKTTFEAGTEVLEQITLEKIERVTTGFSGPQEQVAPAFSALKHQGQPLYKLARQGKMVQKPPRQIEIYSISADNLHMSGSGMPVFDLDVHSSGGTYIRSLAYDIGKKLGCGAHLSALCRTSSGRFSLREAVDLSDLETMSRADIDARVITMSACLDFLPAITADKAMARKVSFGQKLSVADTRIRPVIPDNPNHPFIRIIDDSDVLLAIVRPDEAGLSYNYCCVFTA